MQFHFDFKDWEAAFDCFYEKHVGRVYPVEESDQLYHRQGDIAYCFVISKSPHVSGYWIEKCAKPDDETEVYETLDAVVALHKRVMKARKATVNLSIGGLIT